MGYPCVRHYILFYIHGPAILHFFKYYKIIKIQNDFELRKYYKITQI